MGVPAWVSTATEIGRWCTVAISAAGIFVLLLRGPRDLAEHLTRGMSPARLAACIAAAGAVDAAIWLHPSPPLGLAMRMIGVPAFSVVFGIGALAVGALPLRLREVGTGVDGR